MKRITIILIGVLALAAPLAGSVARNYGRLEQPEEQTLGFGSLSLELSTGKKRFVRHEPVSIVLTLANKKRSAVMGHSALGFSSSHVELFVSADGGAARKIESLSPKAGLVAVTPRKIQPGESVESKQMLTMNLEEVFPQPGKYELKAVLHGVKWEETVESEPVAIHIAEPEGLDRQAYEYIKAKHNSHYFFSGLGREEDGGLDELEEFALNFGQSAYGDHASLLLGRVHFHRKDYARAVEHLSKVAKKPDFAFSDEAGKYLSKAKERLPK